MQAEGHNKRGTETTQDGVDSTTSSIRVMGKVPTNQYYDVRVSGDACVEGFHGGLAVDFPNDEVGEAALVTESYHNMYITSHTTQYYVTSHLVLPCIPASNAFMAVSRLISPMTRLGRRHSGPQEEAEGAPSGTGRTCAHTL